MVPIGLRLRRRLGVGLGRDGFRRRRFGDRRRRYSLVVGARATVRLDFVVLVVGVGLQVRFDLGQGILTEGEGSVQLTSLH